MNGNQQRKANLIHIRFKNLERSELAREAALERIESVVEKFPDLRRSRVIVTLEMENSPHQPGPDLFTVKLHVPRGRYRGVTIAKAEATLYKALAEVVEHALEVLNRFGDRDRVKMRTQKRRWLRKNEPTSAPKVELLSVGSE